jgi:glycogen operon protein
LRDALRGEGLIGARAQTEPFDDALARALHAFVARTPSRLAMAQLDDLAGETEAVNLPGTDRERENWRRKLGAPVEALFGSTRAQAVLDGLRRPNLDDIATAYSPGD